MVANASFRFNNKAFVLLAFPTRARCAKALLRYKTILQRSRIILLACKVALQTSTGAVHTSKVFVQKNMATTARSLVVLLACKMAVQTSTGPVHTSKVVVQTNMAAAARSLVVLLCFRVPVLKMGQ